MKKNHYKITEDVLIKTIDRHGEEFCFYIWAGEKIVTGHGIPAPDNEDYSNQEHHALLSIIGIKTPKDEYQRSLDLDARFGN